MRINLNPALQHLTPYQPSKSYASLKRTLGDTPIIQLGNNENPLGPSPRVKNTLLTMLDQSAMYPDPEAHNFCTNVGAHLQVDPACIIHGNGSAEVIAMIGQAFLNHGDHVVIPAHSFSLFEVTSALAGASCDIVPLNNWQVDVEAIVNACTTHTKCIFIANPNNPTGTSLSHQALLYLLQHIPPTTLLVWDEAYYEFDTSDDKPNAIACLRSYPNLIITRTFSKAYGLAGLRVGFGVAHQKIIEALQCVRLSYNFNGFAEACAIECLHDEVHLQRTIQYNQQQKQWLQSALASLSLAYLPTSTNFMTIQLKQQAALVYQALLQKGVITRTLTHYGMPDYLGVTIGRVSDNQQFVMLLSELLSS